MTGPKNRPIVLREIFNFLELNLKKHKNDRMANLILWFLRNSQEKEE